jgi:hypothetical protein
LKIRACSHSKKKESINYLCLPYKNCRFPIRKVIWENGAEQPPLPKLLGKLHVVALVVPHPDGLVHAAGHYQRLPTDPQSINQLSACAVLVALSTLHSGNVTALISVLIKTCNEVLCLLTLKKAKKVQCIISFFVNTKILMSFSVQYLQDDIIKK